MKREWMTVVLAAVACTLGMTVQSSDAQQAPTTEVCNVAFSQGISDNWHLFTERQQFEAYQHRLCQAKFASYQAFQGSGGSLGLDIPLAEGLLGLSGSYEEKNSQFSQRYERFCQSTYFTATDHQRYQSFVSQVSAALTESWNRCQELHLQAYLQSKGVFVSVTPMGQSEQFVARIQIRTELPGNVTIAAIHPDQAVTCHRGGVEVVPGSEIGIRDFSLTCFKDPSSEIAFNVETSFGQSNQIKVPSGNQRLAEVLASIEQMRAALESQRTLLEKQLKDIESVDEEHRAILLKLGNRKLCYCLDSRYNGSSCSKDGGWTEFKGDGKTPDRIRVYFCD